MRKLIHFPFFSILIGLYPFIALWNFNKSQIYPQDVVQSLLITLAFTIVVWGLCWMIFGSAIRTSIAASLIFILFFSYGHVYNLIQDVRIFGQAIGFLKLLVVYLVLLLVCFFVMMKVRNLPGFTVLLLNGILTFLIVMNLVQIFSYEGTRKKKAIPPLPASTAASNAAGSSQQLPDIYYIILDAYSRQDVMLSQIGYDNSGFIEALRERGFFVADCSNSNYSGTVESVSSSLNYAYLDEKDNLIDENGQLLPFDLSNNRVRADLKKYGYQFVTTRAFSSENDIQNSDIYLNVLDDRGVKDTIAQSQFTRMYFETTLLRVAFEYYYMNPLNNDFLPNWLFLSDTEDPMLGYASYWYNQTLYVLDSLDEFPEKEGNYLVYAHINVPHGPYVFDRNGGFKYTYNPDDNIPYYTDSVIFINQRILDLVDSIIAKSDVPPVIILQGDHGAHVITTGADKHKILNAYYLPGDAHNDLYDTITPVNTFRIILRDYFDAQIGLLPDNLYIKNEGSSEIVPSTCPKP